MSSKKEMERLVQLEAEAAALDQRIARLESQITDMERQGREAFRAKKCAPPKKRRAV